MLYDYKSATDDIEVRNFLDKNKILEIVDEESIFEMVFGFRPKEFEYITSPFRDDSKPGCWFEYSISGKLKFVDWASNYVLNGAKIVSIDCFDAVKLHYNLSNFYETLEFIYKHLIEGKEITERQTPKKKAEKREKTPTTIHVETREFNQRDAQFWKKYGISSANLREDKVFAVKKYQILNSKSSGKIINTFGLSYAYTDFEDDKKKIYSPYASKIGKFITNCGKDDVGGVSSLPEEGDKLIISKSYKDYRVLRNQGYNAVWFQNEGMFPTPFTLLPILFGFKEIIVFFDNDRAGIDSSKRLVEYIKGLDRTLSVREISLPIIPGIKDPSDFIHKKGKEKLNEFLKKEI